MTFKDLKSIIKELNKTLKNDDLVVVFKDNTIGINWSNEPYTYQPFNFEDIAIIPKDMAGKNILHKNNKCVLDQDQYNDWIKRKEDSNKLIIKPNEN